MNLWYELIESLTEEIINRKEEFLQHDYPNDLLHELVDSFIPIYYSDILNLAKDNMAICYPEDEGLYTNDINIFTRLQIGTYEQLMPIAYGVLDKIIEG